jgi:hypothetical protein
MLGSQPRVGNNGIGILGGRDSCALRVWSCRIETSSGIRNRMKSLTEQLWFEVPNRRGFVNITRTIEDLVRKSGVQEGLCLVNAMHITTCVA